MKQGRLTIPTDDTFIEGTKKYVEKWGADGVRDCDGTTLPACAGELAEKVYKTYFVVRGDNAYAYAHDESVQCVALVTDRKTAFLPTLAIDLLEGFFAEQIAVNDADYKKYWQVFDRTENREISEWEFDGKHTVTVTNAKPYHEYTVNFFGKALWDATQVYNYTCNGWTVQKDRDFDPAVPSAFAHMQENLDEWLANNPQVTVVRFTTFFYHFFLLYYTGTKQKLFDWYNYAMSASPAMFELFSEEYGYKIKLEDLLAEGYYGNHFCPGSYRRLQAHETRASSVRR
ncbi:MAG: 1,3-beta-galactosyl-N-acetylhexosamine phosphorylase, partial [Clostridia bacterium]|nr:1,3-beta-galactosyl-N-acetylhexosamine phosphorylase [Clostridia bacterium]